MDSTIIFLKDTDISPDKVPHLSLNTVHELKLKKFPTFLKLKSQKLQGIIENDQNKSSLYLSCKDTNFLIRILLKKNNGCVVKLFILLISSDFN